MNCRLPLAIIAMSSCGGTAKPTPRPTEEAFVLTSADISASSATPSSGAGTPAPGTVPDLSGIVVGVRADHAPPLQGLSPIMTTGNLTGYTPDAPKPFMGYSLIDRSLVSVDSGKIVDVTNGIDPANCPKLVQKLTAAYGPTKKSVIGNVWSVGPAEIVVLGSAKTTCSIMIRLAK